MFPCQLDNIFGCDLFTFYIFILICILMKPEGIADVTLKHFKIYKFCCRCFYQKVYLKNYCLKIKRKIYFIVFSCIVFCITGFHEMTLSPWILLKTLKCVRQWEPLLHHEQTLIHSIISLQLTLVQAGIFHGNHCFWLHIDSALAKLWSQKMLFWRQYG